MGTQQTSEPIDWFEQNLAKDQAARDKAIIISTTILTPIVTTQIVESMTESNEEQTVENNIINDKDNETYDYYPAAQSAEVILPGN